MAPKISVVETSKDFPASTSVVIIGGGIVGLSAALTLAERNISVVVFEKGTLAGEQSSRNLGWVRKTSRVAEDIPLALAADELWKKMPERTGYDVGYVQRGIMFIARNESQMAVHENWIKSTSSFTLGSQLLTNENIKKMVPGGSENWYGGIYTPSDGRAEPTLASSAIARAALQMGVIIYENCAVRGIETSAGRVHSVITEKGEVRCEQVLVSGGIWSRRFLGNLGINFPALPLICSVLRTKKMEGPTETSVGAPDFSFRKHHLGGFIICQRGAVDAPLTLDHLKIGFRYREQLRSGWSNLRIGFGKYSRIDYRLNRQWSFNSATPFEKIRTMDPDANVGLNDEALRNLKAAWPSFSNIVIDHQWAGVLDVTPDSNPVIDSIDKIDGLYVASGFSGHGFGTSPAAGHLIADIISGDKPIVDPYPYRFSRF